MIEDGGIPLVNIGGVCLIELIAQRFQRLVINPLFLVCGTLFFTMRLLIKLKRGFNWGGIFFILKWVTQRKQ